MNNNSSKENNTQVWASPATPQSLDNNFDSSLGSLDAISSCYDSLVEYEYIPEPKALGVMRENIAFNSDIPGGFKMTGKLAQSWDLHKDMHTVTFRLRQGVRSHWGNELTADDVKWSWDRKLALGAIGGFFASVIGLKKSEQIQVDGKYAITFKLDKPAALILKIHRNPRNHIYDSTKIKELATTDDPWAREWISNNMAGYGPYKMVSLERGKSFVAKAHRDYWGQKPAVDNFVMQEVQSSTARTQLIKDGSIDIAQFLTPLEIMSLNNVSGLSIDHVQSSNMVWINLNCKKPPFDNVLVRQAMNYAFPKQDAISLIYKGNAKVLEGVIPDFYPGYQGSSIYTQQNLSKATSLLKEAGYNSGFETYCIYDPGQVFMEPLLVLFQKTLRNLGIRLALKKIPSASFFSELQGQNNPMSMCRYAPWCADPGYAMTVLFLSSSLGNYSGYANDKVDQLVNAASNENDSVARFSILDEAQNIVLTESPWIQICNPDFSLVRNSRLKGWIYRTYNHTKAQDFYWL